jgi:hypothetical protein
MDEAALREIERQVETGRLLPGRDRYALETITRLVAEVRRLRAALDACAEETRRAEVFPGGELPLAIHRA